MFVEHRIYELNFKVICESLGKMKSYYTLWQKLEFQGGCMMFAGVVLRVDFAQLV